MCAVHIAPHRAHAHMRTPHWYCVTMRAWIGTSGYNYPEWRGTFYPEKFAGAEMFGY